MDEYLEMKIITTAVFHIRNAIQKIATHIPNKNVGTHLTHYAYLNSIFVYTASMNPYVNTKKQHETIKTLLLLPILSTAYPMIGTNKELTT